MGVQLFCCAFTFFFCFCNLTRHQLIWPDLQNAKGSTQAGSGKLPLLGLGADAHLRSEKMVSAWAFDLIALGTSYLLLRYTTVRYVLRNGSPELALDARLPNRHTPPRVHPSQHFFSLSVDTQRHFDLYSLA
ncbi:hypothetical protein IWW34DRAFT_793063 [Fusarium oxysporum f. sp. albedinis]|jgi:hypothetical protein|nr:hypothetical protein DER44DRAFT_745562 [Fusarium oxysporum]KAI3574854.1 hypothetical protein IWW34DRAFT_793063 [Fusarium oxysporum f. sp. albedinis]KAJ0146129.1 Ribosome-associated complex subunit SSZ1 [Fusarium oxysporum f. sp. albedinis]KAK2135642.1 hypothetical protein NOF04DRAFT_1271322 [Fusarium oxysporum II5]